MPDINPIRPTDAEACTLANELISNARFGAIGVLDPESGAPQVTRIAVTRGPEGHPLTLISALSSHTAGLRNTPECSLLLGEPGSKGDPLTHPRITLACKASFTEHSAAEYSKLRDHYLVSHPKARLYIDFTDFVFATLTVQRADLNGGFGKAYRLLPSDLDLS